MATREKTWTSGGQHPGGDGLTEDPSAVKLFRAPSPRTRQDYRPRSIPDPYHGMGLNSYFLNSLIEY